MMHRNFVLLLALVALNSVGCCVTCRCNGEIVYSTPIENFAEFSAEQDECDNACRRGGDLTFSSQNACAARETATSTTPTPDSLYGE